MKNAIHGKIDAYLRLVMSQMRWKKNYIDIQLELQHHLEDSIEELLADDIPLEEACEITFTQMGDPILLGRQLNTTHKPQLKLNKALCVAICSFAIFVSYPFNSNVHHNITAEIPKANINNELLSQPVLAYIEPTISTCNGKDYLKNVFTGE
jgi:hypothetical protein